MVAVVLRVMLASARIFPSNAVLVPRVAELPTCQNTPSSEPPLEPKLITDTDEALAVVSELPIWKTQNALLAPCGVERECSRQLSRRVKMIDARHERESAQILTRQVAGDRHACQTVVRGGVINLRLLR